MSFALRTIARRGFATSAAMRNNAAPTLVKKPVGAFRGG